MHPQMKRSGDDGTIQQIQHSYRSADDYINVGVLAAHHLRDLTIGSGISAEVIAARGYRTVTTAPDLAMLGFNDYQRSVPGLLVPIHNVYGELTTYQVRPDHPRRDKRGKSVKYDSVEGRPPVVDVPPPVQHLLRDPRESLWITEGAKKADSAVSHGLCCIAIPGVYGWRGRNDVDGVTALGDWEAIAFKRRTKRGDTPRDVIVCFDSDVMTKPGVHHALHRFGAFLKSRGAKVRYCYLPDRLGLKVGK